MARNSPKNSKIKKLDEKSKGFFHEFKEFIARGNVMDLAVGIIIGAAFTAIVSSLVNDIITPLMGVFIGGMDFSQLSVTLPSVSEEHEAVIAYGSFIQSVINFLLIALCVFILIKTLNTIKTRMDALGKKQKPEKPEEPPAPPAPDPQLVLLEEIRDLLKNGAPPEKPQKSGKAKK